MAAPMGERALFNHLFVTVDTETYEAIRTSPFVREAFAPSEERSTVRTDMSYTGLYLYGVNTYLELFRPEGFKGVTVGDSGLAFGTDSEPAFWRVTRNLSSIGAVTLSTVTRAFQEEQVPWFFSATPAQPPVKGLMTWLMGYHPDFLSRWNPPAASGDSPSGVTTRGAMLERYARVIGQSQNDRRFVDVTGLTVAIDTASQPALVKYLETTGFSVKRDASSIEARTDGFVLKLETASEGRRGITRIDMTTRGATSKSEQHRFGASSVLTIQPDGTGSWMF